MGVPWYRYVIADRAGFAGERRGSQLLPRQGLGEYAATLKAHDVGLSLMYTPHPSLVPLEMASAGLMTVTNTYANKTAERLQTISPNLIAVDATVPALIEGLRQAVAGVGDYEARARGDQSIGVRIGIPHFRRPFCERSANFSTPATCRPRFADAPRKRIMAARSNPPLPEPAMPLDARAAVYTGTFDPVHLGHLDVIRRGARLYDRLIVGVGVNPEKEPLFTPEERVELLRRVTAPFGNVEVMAFHGLTVQFVREMKARRDAPRPADPERHGIRIQHVADEPQPRPRDRDGLPDGAGRVFALTTDR